MDKSDIPTISAMVRRSQQNAEGGWVTVELGATRGVTDIDPDEDITKVKLLAMQLDIAVAEVIGKTPTQKKQDTQKETTSVCPDHGEDYQRFEKDGDIWFAHKLSNGNWCRLKGITMPKHLTHLRTTTTN